MGMRFLLVVLVGCSNSTTTNGSDAAAEATVVTCATSGDCPSGEMCFFAIADGCAATAGICASQNGTCKAGRACTCDGGSAFVLCGPAGRATEPVKSTDLSTCEPADAGGD